MTLRCECGGAVEIQKGSSPDPEADLFWELYECPSCGRTGTYTHYRNPSRTDELTGCLVSVADGGRPHA